jgi:hypothetical protein
VALAGETDDLNLTGHALARLGDVHASAEHVPEAEDAYRRAGAVFRRKGNLASLAFVEERAQALAVRS